VNVRIHEHPGQDFRPRLFHLATDPGQKVLPVLLIPEYPDSFNPPYHDVMKNSGGIQSRLSWHTHPLSQFPSFVKYRFSATSPPLNFASVTLFTKDNFLFLGPGHRFDLRLSNKRFGSRHALLMI
jgi:hypothetical protein